MKLNSFLKKINGSGIGKGISEVEKKTILYELSGQENIRPYPAVWHSADCLMSFCFPLTKIHTHSAQAGLVIEFGMLADISFHSP